MTSELKSGIQLGLSPVMECSYLPNEQEQLLFALDKSIYNDWAYEALLGQGFRRSGNDIYRPHCPSCQSCQSLRLIPKTFTPSTSQKRVRNKTSHLHWHVNFVEQREYYPLYAKYIEARHSSGSMYPPSQDHFRQFIQCDWLQVIYLEAWEHERLVAVAVTDLMPDSLSALYIFYDPERERLSLGTAAVLQEIDLAIKINKPFLYLGYQIDECAAMNYKKRFKPYQKFDALSGSWTKKPST